MSWLFDVSLPFVMKWSGGEEAKIGREIGVGTGRCRGRRRRRRRGEPVVAVDNALAEDVP